MMKRLLFIALVSILLFSCSKSSYTLSSSRISEEKEGIVLYVTTEGEREDEEFSFSLLSPDSDLRWEGKLKGKNGSYSSEKLLITPGASFPRGEYTLVLSSSYGSDVSDKVIF